MAGSGEIAYKFAPNFRAILLQRSLLARWQSFWQKVWDILFYLIRISFGIVLIVSIVIVVLGIAAAIVVINSSSSDSDRQSESENSHRGGSGVLLSGWAIRLVSFIPPMDMRATMILPSASKSKQKGIGAFWKMCFRSYSGMGIPTLTWSRDDMWRSPM